MPVLDDLKRGGETGTGYQAISVELKDGRCFDQVVASEGSIIEVRGYEEIPFAPEAIRDRQSQALEFQGGVRHTHQVQNRHRLISLVGTALKQAVAISHHLAPQRTHWQYESLPGEAGPRGTAADSPSVAP